MNEIAELNEKRIQNLTEQVVENRKSIDKIISIISNMGAIANNNFEIIKGLSNILEEVRMINYGRTDDSETIERVKGNSKEEQSNTK